MMKWIRRYNLSRQQIFGKDEKDNDKSTVSHKIVLSDNSKVRSVNINDKIQRLNTSKSVNSRSFQKQNDKNQ